MARKKSAEALYREAAKIQFDRAIGRLRALGIEGGGQGANGSPTILINLDSFEELLTLAEQARKAK